MVLPVSLEREFWRAFFAPHRRVIIILLTTALLSCFLRHIPTLPKRKLSAPPMLSQSDSRTVLDGVSVFKPVPPGDFEERWRDIAHNTYRDSFRQSFRYTKGQVTLRYRTKGENLQGELSAIGLKPSFAYQIKLRGDYAANPLAHKRIGYAGRWRLPGAGTNYTDADYETSDDKSSVEAYILFDYFVTDKNGNARKRFAVTSSLHVLWSRIQNLWDDKLRSNRHADTQERSYAVWPEDPRYYSQFKFTRESFVPPGKLVLLWAENQHRWQSDRAPIGEMRLPTGVYPCEIVLTEESFHSSGADGGWWATVLAAPIRFEITGGE